MTQPIADRTLVTFLLDRTGSMQPIKDDTIGAFNAYLEGLKEDGALIDFTLVQFDSLSLDKICVGVPVREVSELTAATYEPRAATPLIDAAFKTIKAVETSLTGDHDKRKIVICIQTDGHENASSEHSWNDLNVLIKEKTAAGWQFNFLGCGIDAYEQGQKMGVAPMATMSYDRADAAATREAFVSSARNTRAYASGLASSTDFSEDQRVAAKDAYAHRAQPSGSGNAGAPAPKAAAKPAARRPIVDDFAL